MRQRVADWLYFAKPCAPGFPREPRAVWCLLGALLQVADDLCPVTKKKNRG